MRISRRMALYTSGNYRIQGPEWSKAIPFNLNNGDVFIGPPLGKYGILMYDQRGKNTGYAGSTALYTIDDSETITYINTTQGGHDSAQVLSFGEHTKSPEYIFLSGCRDQSYHFNTNSHIVNKSMTLSTVSVFGGAVRDYTASFGCGILPSYIFIVVARRVSSTIYQDLYAFDKSQTQIKINNIVEPGNSPVTVYSPWFTLPNYGAVRYRGANNNTGVVHQSVFMNDSLTVTEFTPTIVDMDKSGTYNSGNSAGTALPFFHTKNKAIFVNNSTEWSSIDKSLTVNFLITAGGKGYGLLNMMNFKGKLFIAPKYNTGVAGNDNYNHFATIDDFGTYEIIGNSLDKYNIEFMTRSAKRLYAGRDHITPDNTIEGYTKLQVFK